MGWRSVTFWEIGNLTVTVKTLDITDFITTNYIKVTELPYFIKKV
nr:MAG TPA: hypothetical protein [Caudoviricetes sp.]